MSTKTQTPLRRSIACSAENETRFRAANWRGRAMRQGVSMQEREGVLGQMEGGANASPVRSVERAGRILEALLTSSRGLRLVELSEAVGLHKTTVLRLLRTLIAINLVRRDADDDRYHWDPLRWMLVTRDLRTTTARMTLVHGLLQELATATGQTALLSTPDIQRRNMLLIAAAPPRSSVRADLQGRVSAPLHAVAGGKLFLSTLPEDDLAGYLEQALVALTPHTVTAPGLLRAQLANLKGREYAVMGEEFIPQTGGVAVPVRDAQGDMAAALTLFGPLHHHSETRIAQWLPQMEAVAKQISQLLYFSLEEGATEQAARLGQTGVASDETKFRKSYRIL